MTAEIAGDMPVSTVSRGVTPFLLLEILLTVMVIFVPKIVFWLSGLVR